MKNAAVNWNIAPVSVAELKRLICVKKKVIPTLITICFMALILLSERPILGASQTNVTTTITGLTVEPNPDVLSQNFTASENLTFSYKDGGNWSNLTVSATIQPPPPTSADFLKNLNIQIKTQGGSVMTFGGNGTGSYTSFSNGSVSIIWGGTLEVGNATLTLIFSGQLFDNNSIYYLPSSSSVPLIVQPPPTPPPTPTPTAMPSETTVAATATNGTIVDLAIGGNITSSQMSNVQIVSNQSAATTTVSFTVTGESGNTGFGNITIPISAVPYGTKPIIFIDGQPAQNQGFTQDNSNYYLWYTTSFSTHHISIVFNQTSNTPPAPSQSPLTTLKNPSGQSSSLQVIYGLVIAAVVVTIVVVALSLIIKGKKTKN